MRQFDRAIDPAFRNRRAVQRGPYEDMGRIFFGKVIEWHPAHGTMDVALDGAMGQAGIYRDVPITSWSYGVNTGWTYMPTLDLAVPQTTPFGTYDQPIPSGGQDVWVLVGHLNNSGRQPVGLGFMTPLIAQNHVTVVGMELHTNETGMYEFWYADPTYGDRYEWHGSDGSYSLMGTNIPSPIDMISLNPEWTLRTQTVPYSKATVMQGTVSLTIANTATATDALTITLPNTGSVVMTVHAGNVTINADGGNIALNAPSIVFAGGTRGVARTGDAVTVTVDGTVYTGTITGGSTIVKSG